jgi:23S rRNA pseudouridine1911/1915/1917 synthase
MAEKISFSVGESDVGQRLDKVLAGRFDGKTRQYLQKIIKDGKVLVNGKTAKSSAQLRPGSTIEISFPEAKSLDLKAVDIPLDIVYEDLHVIVLNKPAGLVVHPGMYDSHAEDSLVNALLHHCKGKLPGISGTKRPGIVHRLDKDTSGLLVVAKDDMAMQSLTQQFKDRKVSKVYYALVAGRLEPAKGSIDAPIGRDSHDRKRMAVVNELQGRPALTRYQVLEYFVDSTLLEIHLVTGRTHQIRVHFAAIGHPLVGDPIYGRPKLNQQYREQYGLARLFLHAGQLSFLLPGDGSPKKSSSKSSVKKSVKTKVSLQKKGEFVVPLPSDLQVVLDALKSER